MSDFTAKLIPCYSTVSGETPGIGDIRVAEIAINTADGKLFTRHTDGSIKEISGSGGGGGGGSIDEIEDIGNIQPRPGVDPNALAWLWDHEDDDTPDEAGAWYQDALNTPDIVELYKERADGEDIRAVIAGLPATGTLWMAQAAEGVDLATLTFEDFVAVEYLSLTIVGDVVQIRLDLGEAPPEAFARPMAAQGMQLLVNFQNPIIPGESFDGDVLVYDASLGKWVPKQFTLSDISDIETLSTADLADWNQPMSLPTGLAMVWDAQNGEWAPGYPALSGGQVIPSGAFVIPVAMSGPAERRYVDAAEAIAAGWTDQQRSGDDNVQSFPVPDDWRFVEFLDVSMGDTLYINTNGGMGVGGSCGSGRSGNVVSDAGSCPFYIGFWSQDSFLRAVYTKVVESAWIVRCEFSNPYNVTAGYVCEVHFLQAGLCQVFVGPRQAGARELSEAAAATGLVVDGELHPDCEKGWPGVDKNGNFGCGIGGEAQEYVTPSRLLQDLGNVTAKMVPANGSQLVYNATTLSWVDGPAFIDWVQPGVDPLRDSVALLFNFDGDLTDQAGIQNASPQDGWTFPQGKFSEALQFGGETPQALTFSSQERLDLSKDFCIEYWIRHDNLDGIQGHLIKRIISGDSPGTWGIRITEGNWSFDVLDGSGQSVSGGALTVQTWHHLAVTRSGLKLRMFKDGALVAEADNATDFTNAAFMQAGIWAPDTPSLQGMMDDLRITKGKARYTEAFTPPTEPFTMADDPAGLQPVLPIDIHSDVDTSTDPPEDGEALTWDEAQGNWVPKPVPLPGGGSFNEFSTPTGALPSGGRVAIELQTAGRAGMLQKISLDIPAWVVLYVNEAALTADWDRTITTDPGISDGVIAEVIANQAGSYTITPTAGYLLEPDKKIHAKVVSLHGVEANITVMLQAFALG